MGIRVLEPSIADPDDDVGRRIGGTALLDLPADVRIELVERELALGEDARQVEHAGRDGDGGAAAGLGGVELHRGVAETRAADRVGPFSRPCHESQVGELALDAVMQRRIERPVPARRKAGDHALRMQADEQLAQGLAERHPTGDLRHHAHIEPLRRELAADDVAGGVAMPGEVEIGLRPAHAVAGGEAEAAHADGDAIALLLAADAPLHALELERLDGAVEAQRHRAQGDVDGGRHRLALLQIEPATQCAVALAELERQRDVASQLAHVGTRQVGVSVAAPAMPVAAPGEERLGEAATQAEALAPAGRWRGVDAHVVAKQPVAHDECHVAERERRRLAHVVDPAQRAGADHELFLVEEPFGGRVVVAAFGATAEVEPGDADAAARVAAHVEAGAVDQQLAEARLEREHRARRERSEDARQGKGDAAFGVEDAHVGELERRHPAGGLRADRADAHRGAEQAARTRLDGVTPAIDVRQNQPVK